MSQPTSFRLPEALLDRLDDEAAARGTSVTALVTTILDEGLKTTRVPGVVYRDGPAGRRAALAGGPDVWEVIRDVRDTPGKGEVRVRRMADELGVPLPAVRAALDFYAAFPEEIDQRIDAEARTAERLRRLIDQRERLLGT